MWAPPAGRTRGSRGTGKRLGQPGELDVHPLQAPDQPLHLVRLRLVVAKEVVADERVLRRVLDHGVTLLRHGVRLDGPGLALLEGPPTRASR